MIGTQQMNEIRQDMFQAGVRNTAPTSGKYDANILYVHRLRPILVV
jgi:hypothetical protein